MSKTKGNVVDPLSLIDEIGADALRFALVSGTSAGADQRLSPEKLENARNFMNKLWNAARYVLGARPPEVTGERPDAASAQAAAEACRQRRRNGCSLTTSVSLFSAAAAASG